MKEGKRLVLMLALVAVTAWASPVLAAGGGGKKMSPEMKEAGKAMKSGDFEAAIPWLEKAVKAEPKNADAYNWLGYAHRNAGDLDASAAAYEKALGLAPRHRAALEYQGELFLKLGQLEKAEANLDRLDGLCWFGCDEYDDLKEAIAAYQAGG